MGKSTPDSKKKSCSGCLVFLTHACIIQIHTWKKFEVELEFRSLGLMQFARSTFEYITAQTTQNNLFYLSLDPLSSLNRLKKRSVFLFKLSGYFCDVTCIRFRVENLAHPNPSPNEPGTIIAACT